MLNKIKVWGYPTENQGLRHSSLAKQAEVVIGWPYLEKPRTDGEYEFFSGDRNLSHLVYDALRPGGVMICERLLAGNECTKLKSEWNVAHSGKLSAFTGLQWIDDDDHISGDKDVLEY